jgi:hypothetical protein
VADFHLRDLERRVHQDPGDEALFSQLLIARRRVGRVLPSTRPANLEAGILAWDTDASPPLMAHGLVLLSGKGGDYYDRTPVVLEALSLRSGSLRFRLEWNEDSNARASPCDLAPDGSLLFVVHAAQGAGGGIYLVQADGEGQILRRHRLADGRDKVKRIGPLPPRVFSDGTCLASWTRRRHETSLVRLETGEAVWRSEGETLLGATCERVFLATCRRKLMASGRPENRYVCRDRLSGEILWSREEPEEWELESRYLGPNDRDASCRIDVAHSAVFLAGPSSAEDERFLDALVELESRLGRDATSAETQALEDDAQCSVEAVCLEDGVAAWRVDLPGRVLGMIHSATGSTILRSARGRHFLTHLNPSGGAEGELQLPESPSYDPPGPAFTPKLMLRDADSVLVAVGPRLSCLPLEGGEARWSLSLPSLTEAIGLGEGRIVIRHEDSVSILW